MFCRRLASGAGIRPKRARHVLQWCSDRWPGDLSWPSEIERPTPNAAALWEQLSPALICVAAAAEARAKGALAEAERIGKRLDPDTTQVACPDALCAALGMKRAVYDKVVARYANFRGRPRRRSAASRMFRALREAGDVRFQPPPPPPELAGLVEGFKGPGG